MKKNNKGFMLAEVVVTSTLLLTIMVSLFFTFNKIYVRYERLTKYKNIDGFYAIDNFLEYIFNTTSNDNINKILEKKGTNKYIYIINNEICQIANTTYCNKLKKTYNITNLLLINEVKDDIDNLDKTTYNKTFIEYFDYLKKYYPFDEYAANSYLVVAEYKLNNNYYYSSLELR